MIPALPPVILLGLGFTTSRLARLLLLRPAPVFAVARRISRFDWLAAAGIRTEEYAGQSLARLPKGAVVVHTIPPLPADETENLHAFINALEPRRVLYISSTSVYGLQAFVTHNSPPDPSEPKGGSRVLEENWLMSRPWSNLIIRPAAIYGPGRGVHTRIRDRREQRTSGESIVSRTHVDDLAALLNVGTDSGLEGTWPCADEHPCSSGEIARWCSSLLETEPVPAGSPQVTGRSVDGREIRNRLGLGLIYPDYRAGTLASLAEEYSANALQLTRG